MQSQARHRGPEVPAHASSQPCPAHQLPLRRSRERPNSSRLPWRAWEGAPGRPESAAAAAATASSRPPDRSPARLRSSVRARRICSCADSGVAAGSTADALEGACPVRLRSLHKPSSTTEQQEWIRDSSLPAGGMLLAGNQKLPASQQVTHEQHAQQCHQWAACCARFAHRVL
jgi:hypothetical protein